jgi:hypothetical protein
VSVDEGDNDLKGLLTYIAEALDAVDPIGERVFDALASPAARCPARSSQAGEGFSSMTSPVVLVLDDAHVLRNFECRAALSVLADHVPGGSRLAFAGRAQPSLRVARLRAVPVLQPAEPSLEGGDPALPVGRHRELPHQAGGSIDVLGCHETLQRILGPAVAQVPAGSTVPQDGLPALQCRQQHVADRRIPDGRGAGFAVFRADGKPPAGGR